MIDLFASNFFNSTEIKEPFYRIIIEQEGGQFKIATPIPCKKIVWIYKIYKLERNIMKLKYRLFFNLFVIIGLIITLFGGNTHPVKAATCTWTGASSADWTIPENWSDCGGVAPGLTDDVIIPDTIVNPVIPEYAGPQVNQLTIQAGGQLTISGYNVLNAALLDNFGTLEASLQASDTIQLNNTQTGVINNNGTIHVTGVNPETNYLDILSTFNNNGTVDLQNASLILQKGGTHTGTFDGNSGTILFIGGSNSYHNDTNNFNLSSYMKVPKFYVREGTVNFSGTYLLETPITGSLLNVQDLSLTPEPASLIFKPVSTIVYMPETTSVYLTSKLIFESVETDLILPELTLGTNAEVINAGDLEISNEFSWRGGKLSGEGSTEILYGATFSIYSGTHYLDEQVVVNSAIANWNSGNITLSNAATFQNDGTFNANATTTMSGGSNGSFDNNGFLVKKNDGTTTTMDIDFTNLGVVDVQAGELIFLSAMTAGTGTTVDLGEGTLTPGETLTLEADASLVGSGTLNSNLINSGEVSPGSSPGIITVDGNYTQSADGLLTIELGGTTPGSGYDQLAVTGNANLAGTLDVSLLGEFHPSHGDSFTVLTYDSRTGTFTTVNLPVAPPQAGMEWQTEYTSSGLVLTAMSTDTFIFLPMVIR